MHHASPIDDDNHWKISTHVMGALVHGQACYGYTFLLNIKHGANITIETLHRVLQDRFEKNKKQPFKQRVLYLQLDNTTKQCKSKYVFCYLALLVAWGLFPLVICSFLMLGHTHEDIDQFFSRLATYLRKNNATSRIGFRDAILKSFKGKWTDNVIAGDIESAANVSDWLSQGKKFHPMAKKNKGLDQREGITQFHQFKFSLLQGVPIMQVRKWCGDKAEKWRGLMPNSTHHVVFSGAIPTPEDLARNCPPAQRSTKPTDPAYISVTKKGEVSNHTSKVRAGVQALIKNRKIEGEAHEDLQRCLQLMESSEPLPFHWNMDMYNAHRALSAPAQEPAEHKDLMEEGDISADSRAGSGSEEIEERKHLHFGDDEEESNLPPDREGYSPPVIVVGETYLVKMGTLEWSLARIMAPPFIAHDKCYAVLALWLDPIDLDKHIEDKLSKRFIVNKRLSTVHPRGWEEVWAKSLDMRITTTTDGTYNRIPRLQRELVIGRMQSWVLQEKEDGILTTHVDLPLTKSRLRPGQSKPKNKPMKPSKPPKATKPPRGQKAKATSSSRAKRITPNTSAGTTHSFNHLLIVAHSPASSDEEDVPLATLKRKQPPTTKPAVINTRKQASSAKGSFN